MFPLLFPPRCSPPFQPLQWFELDGRESQEPLSMGFFPDCMSPISRPIRESLVGQAARPLFRGRPTVLRKTRSTWPAQPGHCRGVVKRKECAGNPKARTSSAEPSHFHGGEGPSLRSLSTERQGRGAARGEASRSNPERSGGTFPTAVPPGRGLLGGVERERNVQGPTRLGRARLSKSASASSCAMEGPPMRYPGCATATVASARSASVAGAAAVRKPAYIKTAATSSPK